MQETIGTQVTICQFLTTDPVNKQGQSGVIIAMDEDAIKVKFEDGVIGSYTGLECFE